MKKGTNIILTTLLIAIGGMCTFKIKAQTADRFVIGAAGETWANASGSLEWTLGEIEISTVKTDLFTLSQGFHQTGIVVLSVQQQIPSLDLKVYPNPVTDRLMITGIQTEMNLKAEVYDITGRQIQTLVLNKTNIIDFYSYATGRYLVKITDTHSKKQNTFSIIKAN